MRTRRQTSLGSVFIELGSDTLSISNTGVHINEKALTVYTLLEKAQKTTNILLVLKARA